MSTHPDPLATRVARAELWKRILIVVIAVIVTALLVLNVLLLGAIRDTQQTGSPTLRAIAAQQDDIEDAAHAATSLNTLVLDCFDPASECAKETAAREAAQAGAYNAAVIAAQYCADRVLPENYTLADITRCVGQRLDGLEGRHR